MNKKNVAVIFGGVSTEHEISKLSASTVLLNIPEDKYTVIPIYITTDGNWYMYEGSFDNIKNIRWEKLGTKAYISTDRVNGGILRIVGEKIKTIPIDVVFPVLHGINGEDGSIQGLLELAGIPYVGCGILSSAVSMDKAITKILAASHHIEQAPYLSYRANQLSDIEAVLKKIRYKVGYPCFVKPSRSGSSIGVTKATNKKELEEAIYNALKYDSKIVVEKMVIGRELECAVLGTGDDTTKVSQVGEVLSAEDFYDFSAKYENEESKTVIPADIPDEISEEIRNTALTVFNAVDGFGLSRVDFFWDTENNKVIFNEINTMPGFSPISMYYQLFENMGIKLPDLLSQLIEMAIDRRTIVG